MKIIKLIPILLLLFLFSLPLSATIINVPADEATIQAGINIATNGDTVLVAEDTYNENINFNGKSITVASEYLLDSDNSHIDQTIIDGDNSGTVVTMDSGEDSNTVLCGFTIQNGDASGSYGGGIYLYQADPNLRNLIIKDNFATYEGGGIMCFESDPALEKVLISNNSTEARGGGLCAYYHSNPSLNKVTIVKNFANQEGSNIAFLSYSSVTMNNSIVWYWNITNSIYLAATVSFNATYSDIKNGSGEDFFGEGCIDADPLFADPDNNDFQLTWANMPTPDDTKSPCIDTGDPNTPNDPDATPADMGFYYYPQSGISGVVELNGGTGNVQNVSLEVEDSATDTTVATTNPDASGNYRFTLPGGIYDLHATLSGYESETIDNINVPDDQLVIQDTITLYAIQPGYIIGKVSKNDGAGQITSAEISAGGETVNPYPVTGPGGALLWYEYTLELPAGMYDVTASLAGYHDTTRTNVPVNPGDETENIDFELQLIIYESYIDGYVYEGKESPPSVPLESAIVSVDTATATTDANGYFCITTRTGIRELTATKDGYTSASISDIECNYQDTTNVDTLKLVNWEVQSGTQYNMILYATSTFDGEFVQGVNPNSYLAAFVGDSCRGVAEWKTGNHPLWDNYYNLDGYWHMTIVSDDNSGTENIGFKLFNSETDSIHSCNESIIFYDSPDSCDMSAMDFTIPSPVHENHYSLGSGGEGWNWISFNLNAADKSIDNTFSSLTPDYIHQVKTNGISATYFMGTGWVGDLDTIEYDYGYLVQMFDDSTSYNFSHSGEAINPVINSISLDADWNWISYYPYESLTLSEALQSIGGNASIIKTQTKSAINDGGWIGDLTHMTPGTGYKLCMNSSGTLTYPLITSNDKNTPIQEKPESNFANWKLLEGTTSNMVAIADIKIGETPVNNSENFSAGVFDKNGKCRSIGKYTNGFWYFTIVDNVDNDELFFKVYDRNSDMTFTSIETINYQKDTILGSMSDPITVSSKGNIDSDIDQLTLYPSRPNPFKNSTSISYNISQDSHVKITIYNILGQRVKTLVNETLNFGSHSHNWNGTDDRNRPLQNGIYFYKIETDKHSETQKLLKLE